MIVDASHGRPLSLAQFKNFTCIEAGTTIPLENVASCPLQYVETSLFCSRSASSRGLLRTVPTAPPIAVYHHPNGHWSVEETLFLLLFFLVVHRAIRWLVQRAMRVPVSALWCRGPLVSIPSFQRGEVVPSFQRGGHGHMLKSPMQRRHPIVSRTILRRRIVIAPRISFSCRIHRRCASLQQRNTFAVVSFVPSSSPPSIRSSAA